MKKITASLLLFAFLAAGAFAIPTGANADDVRFDAHLKARLGALDARINALVDAKSKIEAKAEAKAEVKAKAEADAHASTTLPRGIQKRLEQGKDLPPGWFKRLFGRFGTSTPDMIAPKILDVDVDTGTSTATIDIKANEKVTAEVRYGTSTPITASSSTVVSASLSTKHEVKLSNLAPNTLYHFVIVVKDANGNVKETAVKEFRTDTLPPADSIAPSIVFMTDVRVSSTSAHVIWITNEASNSKVWLSTSTPVSVSGSATMSSSGLVFYHDMHLTGLQPNTTYFYTVGSADAAGNLSTSSGGSFKTAAE